MSTFDIDAVIGEVEPKPLTYKGRTFDLPAELPAAVVSPFLADDLGLIELVTEALGDAKDEDSFSDVLFAVLRKKPRLPLSLLDAARDALEALLGDDYDEFMKLRPSVTAYFVIAKGVVEDYGMSLTDFFESDEPSGGGESSKETSNSTTESTPDSSGDDSTPTTSD